MFAAAFFVGPGILAGIGAEKSKMEMQKQVCEETSRMQAKYAELYNSSVAYLQNQTMTSKAVQDQINNISADITQSTANLENIQKQFKVTQAALNLGLLLSVIATAIMLYLKHKGMLTLNPLANVT